MKDYAFKKFEVAMKEINENTFLLYSSKNPYQAKGIHF